MAIRESELLAHIYRRSKALADRVRVGPGDDCAVLDLPQGALLITTDQCVEGLHVPAGEPDAQLVARAAIGRSISDIAAMGGAPLACVATACLRPSASYADALFDAMADWAQRWGCPLVGGDIAIADAPYVLTVTAIGSPHPTRGPVLRSTAIPGDAVYVTGALGAAKAAQWRRPCEPRHAEAQWLCDTLGADLHAMIDLSDGLGRDAGRVAAASGVRIELDAAALPVAPDLTGDAAWRDALASGDDYELCFTASRNPPNRCANTGLALTPVGRVVGGSGCVVRTPAGEVIDAGQLGWDHGVS